ncbi:hypothetical protein CYMTET_14682 [Cymbomonas tetramitiformis]|uniref:Uncharacterized protein n=1 Tax=Cymbomonas tetramitiformis TaxID=36881 RepID=A0AAE0LA53_9CHLO|nr:hypothetical protein CYMTET_14682 [Cymbomonas tetramitiformis]
MATSCHGHSALFHLFHRADITSAKGDRPDDQTITTSQSDFPPHPAVTRREKLLQEILKVQQLQQLQQLQEQQLGQLQEQQLRQLQEQQLRQLREQQLQQLQEQQLRVESVEEHFEQSGNHELQNSKKPTSLDADSSSKSAKAELGRTKKRDYITPPERSPFPHRPS